MEASIVKLLDAKALTTNEVIHEQQIPLVESYAVELVITGTVNGRLFLEGSISGDSDKYFSVEAPLAVTGPINKAYYWQNYPFRYLRLRWGHTSGTGAITVHSNAKNTT